MEKQNYWITTEKKSEKFTFKTYLQTKDEMLQVVKLLLENPLILRVEVQATKSNLWSIYRLCDSSELNEKNAEEGWERVEIGPSQQHIDLTLT